MKNYCPEKFKRFKLKYTDFNIDIVNFVKIAYFWQIDEKLENIFEI